MSYIWYKYKSEYKYYISENCFSPFIEVGPVSNNYVDVNPLLRFDELFSQWIAEKQDLIGPVISASDYGTLENLVFHFLALLDRKCGAHIYSTEEYSLHHDLLEGCYGEKVADAYKGFLNREKKIILHWLRQQEHACGRQLFYKEAVQQIYPTSRLYYNNEDSRYVVYIPEKCTDYNSKVMETIKSLFMDVNCDVYLVWEYHFGIIGRDSTMIINQINIY